VPLFKRLGLGSVLGYLAAGLAIGPSGLGVFSDPHAILGLAEFGVVMFLFVIGLEMQPRRLWSLRREIFGLGLLQVVLCGAALTGAGMLAGAHAAVAFVAAMGFVLSSTAIVMQMLDERGQTSTKRGQHYHRLDQLACVLDHFSPPRLVERNYPVPWSFSAMRGSHVDVGPISAVLMKNRRCN
jgi:Kef-type K+ transport system membrane component KefB